mgnify:FL=1|tara:strand:- start:7233 stop:7463 length:231 start_codon:yes stop_codon:yes gene_type:complete
MEIFWSLIVAIVLAVFFVFDRYDFGTGIIHLFFAKSEKDTKLLQNLQACFETLTKFGWLLQGNAAYGFSYVLRSCF